MASPTLTDAEIAQLEKDKAAQESAAETILNAITNKTAKAAEYAVSDGAFKKFFDYYNDDIIGQYDAEYRALNGRFIVSPIVEADITGPATLDLSHRTTPSLPDTDVVRIAEFDGGGTSTDIDNEEQHISDQADIEDTLVNGYTSSGGFNPATAQTNSILDGSSTTLDVVDSTNALTIQIGDTIIVEDGSSLAVVEITSVTDNMGGDPPYDFTYGIDIIVPPASPIPATSNLQEFTGFNNTERTNKTASDPALQPLMDHLISELEDRINDRIARLDEQITALNANEDPDAVSEIADTLTDVNTSKTFLQAYLISTDISDTGLGTLSTERGTRSGEITTRISQINANYTGQTENYYDRRYNIANDRANTARGTKRLQLATEATAASMQDYADNAQDAADAIGDLLS